MAIFAHLEKTVESVAQAALKELTYLFDLR